MIDQTLSCLTDTDDGALPLHTTRPATLDAFLAGLPDSEFRWLRATGFRREIRRTSLAARSGRPGRERCSAWERIGPRTYSAGCRRNCRKAPSGVWHRAITTPPPPFWASLWAPSLQGGSNRMSGNA